MARFYLTTAIDYANGDPHLGHALEKIGADAIARYRRLRGDDVSFLMGMDEHGQKVAQAAAERGVEPQAFVDEVADTFARTWAGLLISNDRFIRTTEPAHKAGVAHFIECIAARNPGDFYEKAYEGWYCVGCELFKRETEIENGMCVLHPTRPLDWAEERNWFFRLSRYEPFLRQLFATQPDFLRPASRRNEVLGLLESGLEDISITRSTLSWAIPFPRASSDGSHQGTWVWFDALPNYLTATGYPNAGYESRWPAQLHVVGKDITRLHCVVWPAMLEAAGLPLPEQVWAHGFMSFNGQRFSKSAGVWVELADAVHRHGPDALRYFLLRDIPFDGDGDFRWDRFDDRYEADLANGLGNLASRSISMVERYCGGVVPAAASTTDDSDDADYRAYHAAMDGSRGYPLHEALAAVWRTVGRANEYVQASAPWRLAKDPAARPELERVLASLVRRLALHAVHLVPFMPGKAEELWTQLGAPGRAADARFDALPRLGPAGWRVAKGAPLFPKEALGDATV
ncbi:MAG: methionine--tRNA ligase [Gemmatimonadaceae bacterium]